MKNLKIALLTSSALTLILEALPFGAVCVFARPEWSMDERRLYSYFDLTPYGYANFAPFITALLSVAILTVTVIYISRKASGKYLPLSLAILSGVTALISLCPLLYGIMFFSLVGALITVSLALTLAFSIIVYTKLHKARIGDNHEKHC